MSGFIKKIWKDRVTEFPTRRSLTKQDGSVDLVTVAREEGTVSQEGDAFSAQNMNDLEERVKTAFDAVDSSLSNKVGNFTSGNYKAVTGLAYDPTNNKLGLKVGADTVIPFSGTWKELLVVNKYAGNGGICSSYNFESSTFKADDNITMNILQVTYNESSYIIKALKNAHIMKNGVESDVTANTVIENISSEKGLQIFAR